MDERTLRVLEFDKVLERLAERAASSLGKELAQALRPVAEVAEVCAGQRETCEAVAMLESCDQAPFGGLHDIRAVVGRARAGSIIQPEQLLAVADTLRCTRLLRAYLLSSAPTALAAIAAIDQSADREFSLLADRAQSMQHFQTIEKDIERCIDIDGEIKDSASPALLRIRQQKRTAQARVREKLESLVHSSLAGRVLQEAIITLRNGRYVVPVKQEHRTAVPGIVHDQSGSGATLFVEPMPVVELNNQLRELDAEERDEIERILQELSAPVGSAAATIIHTVDIAAEMDLIFAKARLSLDWRCVAPVLNTQGQISLRRARHPLLSGNVVPIDVHLGREFWALVITGPNTGGKTVTLKTVGLFALMFQAGLQLPAGSGTEMAVFDTVFADIGDEQSIEQNLSTFSSHMSNIVHILCDVTASSLVLLDELGAGTDPTEGAALAMSILEFLMAKDCRTVATTHYSELKAFAYTERGAENASVEFDVETLRPTYRLTVGVAGSSNAFAIAHRLGLEEAVIARAKERLSLEHVKVEDMIRAVEADSRQAAADKMEAERLRAEQEALRAKHQEALTTLNAKRAEMMEEARRNAADLLSEARKEISDLIGALRKAGQNDLEETARTARLLLEERQDEVRQQMEAAKADAQKAQAQPDMARSDDMGGPLRRGDAVRICSLGLIGEALGDPDAGGQVLVQAGALKMTVSEADLVRVSAPNTRRPVIKVGYSTLAQAKSTHVSMELDLRGMKVEEALVAVDKYLDDLVLTGLPKARIIHGKGTGALRQAVREHLRAQPHVRTFRYGEQGEGGDGVTVVEL